MNLARFHALTAALQTSITRAKHVLSAYSPGNLRTMVQLRTLAGGTLQNIELLLPYGMSARPVGQTADLLVFRINNSLDHKVAIAADDPACRITNLEAGEFGFQDNQGQQVVFRRTGIVATTTLGITMNTPYLRVTGSITAGYGGAGQVGLQTHTHDQPNDDHGDIEQSTNAPNAGT